MAKLRMEPISINIQPPPPDSNSGYDGNCLLANNLAILTSPSLNALSPQTPNDSRSSKRHSLQDTAHIHRGKSSVKKLSHWKLYKIKNELDQIYCKMKRQSTKFRENHVKRSASKDRGKKRTIKVEYIEYDDDKDGNSDSEEDTLELPDHNYSPSLHLMDLADGCFSANLPLNALPEGSITIRIRNYKMEVIVGRRSSLVDDKHRISCPVRYGDIDIPIYVNPETLTFNIDDSSDQLFVTGLTKGYYGGRSLSISTNELHPNFRSRSPEKSLSSLSRSRSCVKSTKVGSPKRTLSVTHSPDNSFRRRARTH